jgi:hypothetical protein
VLAEASSISESNPKPSSATDPASKPARIATTAGLAALDADGRRHAA